MIAPLIVFGSGGHAKVLVEAALACHSDRAIYILDDDESARGRAVLGHEVCGGRDWLSQAPPEASVALGLGNNSSRASLMDWLAGQGRQLETVMHPSAIVSPSARIDVGAFLAAGSIVMSEAWIGRGAIVNTAASVDHDCRIGTAVHLAPGVRLCGGVSVGDRSLIGVGSVVTPGVCIGADVVVGGGSAVIADIDGPGRFAGCPARPLL